MVARNAHNLADNHRETKFKKQEIPKCWGPLQSEFDGKKNAQSGTWSVSWKQRGIRIREKWRKETRHTFPIQNIFRGLSSSASGMVRTEGGSGFNAVLEDYEEAIRIAARATMTGDAGEEEIIERILRAGVFELRAAKASGEEEDRAYQRAIDASLREAEVYLRDNLASAKWAQSRFLRGKRRTTAIKERLAGQPELAHMCFSISGRWWILWMT